MHKDKFRLQKVFEVRSLVEKKHQKELAFYKNKIQAEEKGLQVIKEKKKDFTETMINVVQPSVAQILSYYDYLISLYEDIENHNHTIEKLKNELQQERQKLLKAMKDKKILEILKEKFMLKVKTEENKKEQIEIDEIAIRARRK